MGSWKKRKNKIKYVYVVQIYQLGKGKTQISHKVHFQKFNKTEGLFWNFKEHGDEIKIFAWHMDCFEFFPFKKLVFGLIYDYFGNYNWKNEHINGTYRKSVQNLTPLVIWTWLSQK